MRFIIGFLLLLSSLYAQPFTEVRYSDAFDKNITLQGDIEFFEYGVSIKYNDTNKSIFYDDGDLTLYENEKALPLEPMQAEQMGAFFDILLLLHSNNSRLIDENFVQEEKKEYTILIPKGEMQDYLQKIKLQRHKGRLSFIKLFLKNSDTITIKIGNEKTP